MFEGRAELHTAECAYQTACHFSLGGNCARDLLLVRPGVAQKLDGQSLLLKRFDARLFHLLAYPLHVVQVILEQNVIQTEVFLHALDYPRLQIRIPVAEVQTPQRSPKYQTIKTAQRSVNRFPIFVDKLLHDVLQIVLFCR